MMYDGLECPKCGKHTIIQRSNDLFQCLNCDFVRDLSYTYTSTSEQINIPPPKVFENEPVPTGPPTQPDDAWDAVGAVIIFVILALFLGL
jgi:hypothetical protein